MFLLFLLLFCLLSCFPVRSEFLEQGQLGQNLWHRNSFNVPAPVPVSLTTQSQPPADSRGGWGGGGAEHHHHYTASKGGSGWGSKGGGGWGWGGSSVGSFQSFFDIALTGLAFLSFGIFLLNLLMNALIGSGFITGTLLPTGGTGIVTETGTGTGITTTGTGTVPTFPTTSTGTGGGTSITLPPTGPTVNSAGKKRRRRKRCAAELFNLELDPLTSMDAMAAFVLKSIDAFSIEHQCVKKVFCDGNKEARLIGRGFQYFTPAISLSASYLSSKMGLYSSPNATLDNLNGIWYGMKESNCLEMFPDCGL